MPANGCVVNRVTTDGLITTLTGRKITLPPKIRTDTNRKCVNDLLKHDAWLIQQAQDEAKARNDEYNLLFFSQMKPSNLSPANKDLANMYLFDEVCIVFTLEDPKEGMNNDQRGNEYCHQAVLGI